MMIDFRGALQDLDALLGILKSLPPFTFGEAIKILRENEKSIH